MLCNVFYLMAVCDCITLTLSRKIFAHMRFKFDILKYRLGTSVCFFRLSEIIRE